MTEHESDADFVDFVDFVEHARENWLRPDGATETEWQGLLALAAEGARRAVTPALAEDVERTVARALCLANGYDPDERNPAFPEDDPEIEWRWQMYLGDARVAIAAIPHVPDRWCMCDIPIQAADDTSLCDRCRRKLIARVTDGAERQRGLLEAAEIAAVTEDLAEGLRMSMACEVGDEHMWRPQADDALKRWAAIRERAAAARPGEAGQDDGWCYDLSRAPVTAYGEYPNYLIVSNGKHVGVGFRQLSEDPDDYEWQDESTSYIPDIVAWRPLPPAPRAPARSRSSIKPCCAMSEGELRAEWAQLSKQWVELMQDDEGHAGSPGEWIVERSEEIKTELKRRWPRDATEGER